jgi:hypothetical protein
MAQLIPGKDDPCDPISVSEALKEESDRLRHLAEQLESREQSLKEMEANYPHLRQFAFAKLREEFQNNVPEILDGDLEKLAQQEEALPLEAFLHDLEEPPGGGQ